MKLKSTGVYRYTWMDILWFPEETAVLVKDTTKTKSFPEKVLVVV